MNEQQIVYGYIYMLKNTINDKAYIGQTVNLTRRMQNHRTNARGENNLPIYNAMRKYGEEKFALYVLDEAYSKEELDELEKHYIEHFNTFINNRYGYNLTMGGGGSAGLKTSDERKKELSKMFSGENNPFYGKTHTKETKAIMSKLRSGKPLSEEHWKKIQKNRRPQTGKNNPSARRVAQIDLDGNIVAFYDTIAEASLAMGSKRHCIDNAIHGKNRQKRHKGFVWKFAEDIEGL